MFTFRGEEITDEKLEDPSYRLDVVEGVYKAIANNDYSEISETTVLNYIPGNIRLRDGLIWLLAKDYNAVSKFLAMVADTHNVYWPISVEVTDAQLLQLMAAVALVTNNIKMAESMADRAIALHSTSNATGLARLIKRAIERCSDRDPLAPAKLFKSSLYALTLDESINPEKKES